MADYPLAVATLLTPPRRASLGPGSPNREAYHRLKTLSLENIENKDMADCCLAGLWLYHDYLDEAHKICQDVGTPEGSYWHAIMHRREPDYANSKYWFRRVGKHPVVEAVAKFARTRNGKPEYPFAFVDLCERYAGAGTKEELACMEIQQREWELLFDYCYQAASPRAAARG